MANITIEKDSKLIKVLASQAANKAVKPEDAQQAAEIVNELAKEMTPENRHQIAQAIGYTVQELQSHSLDFLGQLADVKNVGYGDKALFNIKTGGIKAYIQAKGSTTARSYVSDRQVSLETQEISARPAINIVDLRCGRVNIADLIREANEEMTNKKLVMIESVLHDAIDDFSSPFYASGTGIVKNTIDAQIAYFRRLGPVTLLGDYAAVSQFAGLTGMAMNGGQDVFTQRSDDLINEFNNTGMIGRYNGSAVLSMENGYAAGATSPILATDWIYILPAGLSSDMRNLKVVNEGGVNAFESQNIDDLTFEVRLDEWFGAAFISGQKPNMGAYRL